VASLTSLILPTLLLFLLASGPLAAAPQPVADANAGAQAPKVAVLVEPGLPAFGAPLDLPPPVLLRILEREGIAATALSVSDLADSKIFNAKRFAVLVMTSGTVYPLTAMVNLREFRSRGGCLVTSGFPFHGAYEKKGDAWKAVPGRPAWDHGPGGMGIGMFGVLKAEVDPSMDVPGNPLGFKWSDPSGKSPRTVWMEPHAEDKLYPLLTIRDERGTRHAAAALIRHRCREFSGACDVWLGAFSPYSDITDRNITERLFCGGVLWCLKERGLLTSNEFAKRLQAIHQRKVIAKLPEKLSLPTDARPWPESLLPKSAAPASKLLVVDTRNLSVGEKVALTCLQGLTAREQPRIWLIRPEFEQQDRKWLEEHKAGGHIEGWEDVTDVTALFRQFKGVARGAIVADPGLYRGDLVALNVAMCEDLILASPELAALLELPVKVDLRGRFKTYAEAMDWVWATYKGKFNRFVCDYMWPGRLAQCVFDYALQWRAPLMWIVGGEDAGEPGADRSEEVSVIGSMFAEMAPNSVVMGFPAQGAVGIGEPEGVQLASRYGRGLVCTNSMANLSVMSGVRLPALKQARPPAPKLDPKKVYVALTTSDGDNLNCWSAGFFARYFEHPSFGSVPVAFTMGPALHELAPVIAQWFFKRAAPNTEFVCGVAGATYTAPNVFGAGYANPAAAWSGFFKWTTQEMGALDMRTLNITPGARHLVEAYSRGLPFCHSLIYGWRRDSGAKFQSMAYMLPTGMPGFDSALMPLVPDSKEAAPADKLLPAKRLIADLAALPKAPRPLFLNTIVDNWSHDMENLEFIGKNAPADVVFVTPAQLAELYREAKKR
jgi:hypothetical protein